MEADAMLRFSLTAWVALPLWAFANTLALAQSPQATAGKSVETSIAETLNVDPLTSAYRLRIESKAGKVVLKGRVGSKAAHDRVVRTAIAFGSPISDELIIDTTVSPMIPLPAPWALGAGPIPFNSATYPPPLFGRYYDPFFAFDPPLVTYPPWWGEMSRQRLANTQPMERSPAVDVRLPQGTVEMTIDPLGVAVIRGTVPTETDKAEVGQHLLQMEGVTKIINRLTVDPTQPIAQATRVVGAGDDQPPPPPTPSEAKPVPLQLEPAGAPIRLNGNPPINAAPASRVDRAIQARPELAGLGIKVSLRDGIATISGTAPGVYEAMLAYRAVEQTPGVKGIVDMLAFVVPDGTSPNPLLTKATPDDAESYLAAQIRRQVGDGAHIDRVRIGGNQLEVKGTVERADDRPRVEAILRSMPILRGFTILPELRPTEG
jgi:osmotically-inducible protein OsmY